MAIGFTARERAGIVNTLRQAAGRCAEGKGMKKTTVDELAAEAGISKGAFYKFYPSKEHLFLDMLEQWHHEIERRVDQALADQPGLSAQGRAATILKTACQTMREPPLGGFCRDELPFVLRKLPEALLSGHYQSNEEFIRSLMARANIRLNVSETIAYATIRILLYSLLMAPQVGEGYAQALDSLIDGACRSMVKPDETEKP